MITEDTVRKAFIFDGIFSDPDFLNVFEDHIPYILARGKFSVRNIDLGQALRYKGDFNGLLMDLGIEERMRYPTMRLTGLTSSTDFDGDITEIKVVDNAFYTQLSRVASGQKKKA